MASGLLTQYYNTNTQTTRLHGYTAIASGTATAVTDLTNPVTAGKNSFIYHYVTGNMIALTFQTASQEGTNQFRAQHGPPSSGSGSGVMHLFYGEMGGSGSGSIGPDYHLDIPTISNISASSPSSTVTSARTFQVSGINQQVMLRVTRGVMTQNANWSINRTYVRIGNSSNGPWTTTTFNSDAYTDINVTAGMFVQIAVEVTSTGNGIARVAYPITITNRHVTQTVAAFNVDLTTDNDFIVADPDLDHIDWANISDSVTANSRATSNAAKTLSGINQTINLRATITNLSGTAFAAGTRLEMYVGGTMTYHSTTLNNGAWAGGNVDAGASVYFRAALYGVAGEQRNVSYTVTVTNVTTGAVVDTFTVSQTVGVADTTANTFTLSPFSLVSNDNDVWISGTPVRIGGINRPITLRIEATNRVGADMSTVDVWTGGTAASAGTWTHRGHINAGAGYLDVTVTDGEWMRFDNHTVTNAGKAVATFNYTIKNITTAQTLCTVNGNSITVDNDNNHNVVDVTPDAISFAVLTGSTNAETLTSYTQAYQVTGINQNITIRHERYNPVTDSARPISTATMTVQRATASGGPWTDVGSININAAGLQYVDLVTSNNQWFRYKITATTASRSRYIQFDVAIWNLSVATNVQLFRRNTNKLTVDADDNYNATSNITPRDWANVIVSNYMTNGSSSQPNYKTNAAQTIAGLAAGQTATISLSHSNLVTGAIDEIAGLYVEIWKNNVNQGTKLASDRGTTAVTNNYTPVTVTNGDSIYFRVLVTGRGASQRDQYTYCYKDFTVHVNASAGGQLDTFLASGVSSDQYSGGGGGGIEI